MAIAPVTSAAATNAATATTGGVDTTGANFLVVVLSYYTSGSAPVVSDSKSNTWNALTAEVNGAVTVQIFYSVPSSVGASHTFSVATSSFNSIIAMAFSGANATQGTPQESGASASTASLQPGSITPAEDNELVIVGAGTQDEENDTFAIDSGFTLAESNSHTAGVNFGGAAGYKIQTTAAAVNPAVSWTTSVVSAARMASFKVSAAVAGFDAPFPFFLGLMGTTSGATYAFPVVSGRTNRIFRHITPVAGVLR